MAGTHNLQDAIYNLKASNLHIVSPPADAGVIDVRGNDGAVVAYNTSSSLAAKLPNETTSPIGLIVYVSNAGSGTITVTDTAGTTIDTVVGSGGEIKGFQLSAARTWVVIGSGTSVIDAINASLTDLGRIGVPLASVLTQDGTPMVKQATTVTGFTQLSNKNLVINIPANANGPVSEANGESFAATSNLPSEHNDELNAELVLNVVVSKDADADSLTLDAELYARQTNSASWSIDTYGGAAVPIVAAGSVLQFAAATSPEVGDLSSVAFVLTLGGTNDSDAVYIHDIYWTYRKKLIAS